MVLSKKYFILYIYNKINFQIDLPWKLDKKSFKYNIFVKDNFYKFDMEIISRRFSNNREDGPFQVRFNVYAFAEDFQFKSMEIKQKKPPKKINGWKKNKGEQVTKKDANEKILEPDDVKSEEGVLKFYSDLQIITKSEEKQLSDSDDDE